MTIGDSTAKDRLGKLFGTQHRIEVVLRRPDWIKRDIGGILHAHCVTHILRVAGRIMDVKRRMRPRTLPYFQIVGSDIETGLANLVEERACTPLQAVVIGREE